MPRRPAVVTQADVARVVRALKGETTARVRIVIEGGRVIVEEAPDEKVSVRLPEDNDDDEVIVL
jgi:diaminopimelate decarboxylase